MSFDDNSFYYVIGVLIATNLGLIVAGVSTTIKVVYNYAVLVQKVEALHKRQDKADERIERIERGK